MEANIRLAQPDFSIPTQERILFLDSLRGIAIIMVVGVHSLGYCLPLPNEQKVIISFIIHTISVPVFFLVDGYLFARSISLLKNYNYLENIRKGINRLIVPWVIFTASYLIARYVFEISGFLQEKLIVGHSLQEIIISAYGSVFASQMYFLFSLFLIRLCGPLFRKIVSIKNNVFIYFLFFIYFVSYKYSISFIAPYLGIEGGQEPILHALWGIQYYFIGIILFKTLENIKAEKLFIPIILFFLVVLLTRNELQQFGRVLIQYLYLVTLFLFFVLIGERLFLLSIIGKNTMGIYLIHTPIILKAVSLFSNKYILFPMLNFLSILFGTFILTFCIVIAIKNLPYGPFLFGEKKSF